MKLIVSLLLTLGVGAVAAWTSIDEISTWYGSLQKPSWTPPAWLFSPVWTLLYILMGVAFWMVWKRPVSERRNAALVTFLVQLALNFIWTVIFFNFHAVGWASIEIVVLWVFIGLSFFAFRRISKTAALLLLPYWAWVTFAAVLNIAVWRMNVGGG